VELYVPLGYLTPFSSLNKKAGLLAQGIINSISEQMKETEEVEVA